MKTYITKMHKIYENNCNFANALTLCCLQKTTDDEVFSDESVDENDNDNPMNDNPMFDESPGKKKIMIQ